MLRKVYLEGEMGDKFGTGFQIYADSVADVMRNLEANLGEEIRGYLVDCHDKDIGFVVEVADNTFDTEAELLMQMHEGDVTITPMPAGSKSALGKILAAIVLVIVAIYVPQMLTQFQGVSVGLGAPGSGLTFTAASKTIGTFMGLQAGTISLGLGLMAASLAMMGIMQMMAPDPAVDQAMPETYLFNGPEQNVVQGDPVPVLYGRLRVPGQPVNFEIAGTGVKKITHSFNEDGSSYSTENSSEREEQ